MCGDFGCDRLLTIRIWLSSWILCLTWPSSRQKVIKFCWMCRLSWISSAFRPVHFPFIKCLSIRNVVRPFCNSNDILPAILGIRDQMQNQRDGRHTKPFIWMLIFSFSQHFLVLHICMRMFVYLHQSGWMSGSIESCLWIQKCTTQDQTKPNKTWTSRTENSHRNMNSIAKKPVKTKYSGHSAIAWRRTFVCALLSAYTDRYAFDFGENCRPPMETETESCFFMISTMLL